MLIRLLELLKSGKSYTFQELAELADMNTASVKAEIEYLEHTGYIKSGSIQKEKNNRMLYLQTSLQRMQRVPDCIDVKAMI